MAWAHLDEKCGVRARKEHTCCFCGEPIPTGSKYDRLKVVDGGEFLTMAMHPECNLATKDWDEDDCETCWPGEMQRGGDCAAVRV